MLSHTSTHEAEHISYSSPGQAQSSRQTTDKIYKWILISIVLSCIGALLYGSASLLSFMKATLFALEPTIPTASVFFFLCVAVTNPFSVGYAVIVLSCGAVFGWHGFLIVYVGSIVGATFWFTVFRICTTKFDCQIHRLIICCCQCFNHAESTELTLRTIDLALSTHPVRSAALVQLTFLPFGSVVSLLASTQIELLPFIAACCISRVKLINYIWLARSAVGAFTRDDDDDDEFHITDFMSLIVSLSFSVTSLAFIAYYAKKQLSELRSEDEHDRLEIEQSVNHSYNHADECRLDIELQIHNQSMNHKGDHGLLSPRSVSASHIGYKHSINQPINHSSDHVAYDINDEYASLLRPSTRHSISHSIDSHIPSSDNHPASDEEAVAAIASVLSPRNRVAAVQSYQASTASPRHRIHSNASPTNAYNPHR